MRLGLSEVRIVYFGVVEQGAAELVSGIIEVLASFTVVVVVVVAV